MRRESEEACEGFRQIGEAELLKHLKDGCEIIVHLQNGRVIVATRRGQAKSY